MSLQAVPPHSLFAQTVESSCHYRLFIDDMIQEGSEIHSILNVLHDATDLDSLELRINSGGGNVKHGQQFINVVQDKFKGRTVTILESEANSMASLVFMAGDRRVIYPHSLLMIHEISMYMGGKSSESTKRLAITIESMKAYLLTIFKGTLQPFEVDEIFEGKDFWFNAETMCYREMATHVIVEGETLTAEEYLESLQESTDENSDS